MAEDKGNSYLETVFGRIKNKFTELLKRATRQTFVQSVKLYNALASVLQSGASINATPQNVADVAAEDESLLQGKKPDKEIGTIRKLLDENRGRLITRLQIKHVGRMIMFYYDPALKKELPYYDRFPMVIPIEFYNDGFLGLNLHYLPNKERAVLLDILYNIFYNKTNHLDEKRMLQISYEAVKYRSRTRLYLPCIKKYKYKQLRSPILLLKPDHWQIVLFLPLERFAKKSLSFVHQESLRLVRGLK